MCRDQRVDDLVDIAARKVVRLELVDLHVEPRLVGLDERQNVLAGGTRRMRMPTSVMMLTWTSAARAEIQSPSGTKCRKSMTTATMSTRIKPELINIAIRTPPIKSKPILLLA